MSVTVHCRNVVYLQHGGGKHCVQNGVTVTPCARPQQTSGNRNDERWRVLWETVDLQRPQLASASPHDVLAACDWLQRRFCSSSTGRGVAALKKFGVDLITWPGEDVGSRTNLPECRRPCRSPRRGTRAVLSWMAPESSAPALSSRSLETCF